MNLHRQLIEADPLETVEPLENELFTDLTEKLIWECEEKKMMPLISVIAADWFLDLNEPQNVMTAYRILTNSAKCN